VLLQALAQQLERLPHGHVRGPVPPLLVIICLLGELLLLPDEEGLDVVLVVILRVPGRECPVGQLSEPRLQRPAVVFA